MANILFLTETLHNACSFYRVSGVIRDLRRKMPNDDFTLAEWNKVELSWPTLMNFDLIFCQRPFTKGHLEACQYIKTLNIPLWLDYDDNLFCVPEYNKASLVYGDPKIQNSIKEILATADVLTVTNNYLKEAYLPYNKNIEIVPNAFNDSILMRPKLPERSHVALWRGTETHIKDVLFYSQAIDKATIEYDDKQFIYLGYYPWFLHKSARTENLFFMKDQDIILYHKNSFNLNPFLLHVPLVDDTFNRCKSDIAFIEGTYFGAACVVPEWWNAPGALKYTDPKSYFEAMEQIITGQVDVSALNHIAWEYVMDELALSKVNVKRMQIINSLL